MPPGWLASPPEPVPRRRTATDAPARHWVYDRQFGKLKQRGNMLGIGQSPSTRIVSKGPLFLRVVALALLGVLVLAGSAHARGPGSDADATAAPLDNAIAQSVGGVAVPGGDEVGETTASTETPEAGVTAGPSGEEVPQAVPAGPPAEEQAPEAPAAPPAEEKAPEAPAAPPAEEKAPEAPAAPPAEEKAPETAPAGPVGDERTLEVVPADQGKEEPREGPASTGATAPQDAATTEHASGEPAPEGPNALLGSLPPSVDGVGATSTPSNAGRPALAAAAGMTAAQRPGDFICELSALGVRTSGNCSAGWLTAQRDISAPPIGLAGAIASLTVGPAGPPPGGGHGGSAVGNPPVSPANGSAPSGASGGSAMGPSGLALSGFLTLAGLLLLGAPRAMRRLRLSCEPWRTACFVLIPERPG
jgi:hypothetical protein